MRKMFLPWPKTLNNACIYKKKMGSHCLCLCNYQIGEKRWLLNNTFNPMILLIHSLKTLYVIQTDRQIHTPTFTHTEMPIYTCTHMWWYFFFCTVTNKVCLKSKVWSYHITQLQRPGSSSTHFSFQHLGDKDR